MKKLFAITLSGALLLGSCSNDDESTGTGGSVQTAIDAIENKATATDITIAGELNGEDWETLRNIRTQLPNVENITLSDVKRIDFGVFVYNDGVRIVPNDWLRSFYAPKAETIGASAFSYCEALTRVELPNVTSLGDEAFYADERLLSANIPKLTSIGNDCYAGCSKIASIRLTSKDPIATTDRSFNSLDTSEIALTLFGYEAAQVVGHIWKDKTWKYISGNGQLLPAADFGIANWGCSLDFVEKHETGTPVSGGNDTKRIYDDHNGNWKSYLFNARKELIGGVNDYSMQFGGENTELIFLPITSYQTTLSELRAVYGNPYEQSEDVFSFNMKDKNASTPGYAYAESQWVMNGSKTFVYKFRSTRTEVECKLSSYLRTGKYQTWGFTITTTYAPAAE